MLLLWVRIAVLVLLAAFGSVLVQSITAVLCMATGHMPPAWVR